MEAIIIKHRRTIKTSVLSIFLIFIDVYINLDAINIYH